MEPGERAFPLTRVYDGWEQDHRLLVASISPLTDEQLALRVAPHLRDVGHLTAHIVAARARMFHWILKEGGEELDALAIWDGFDQPAPSAIRPAGELVHGLDTTWRAIRSFLDSRTVGDLDELVSWSYGGEKYSYTRQSMIWNLVRHDYQHFGEIALTLGAHGIPTPDF